jgi:hypothetical protein
MERGVLVERPISPQLIVVGSILRQNSSNCASLKTIIWSTHSRRIDPISSEIYLPFWVPAPPRRRMLADMMMGDI